MKKILLTVLPVLFTAILTNAQELTSYRGAFAPAPTPMWTENWVNWDPQNASYPATNVNVAGGHITINTTWTSNNTYLLQGLVYVDSLVTLTIQPGTVIRGATATNASLIVRRGAKLLAEGNQCHPIVFTSNEATGARAVGNWGGVILLGRAKHSGGTQNVIEGVSAADLSNYHGGTDDEDNSGVLKYVRIEFGGFVFAPNNEINGLTMGSVGRGTTIDYVQTSFINDDGFEWFGGSVTAKHLVSFRNLDDDFDTDFGFSGMVQYGLAVKDPAIADNPTVSTSEGFESDNDPVGTFEGQQPKTSAKFYNITQVGAFRCASNAAGSGVAPTAAGFRRGLRLRRNTDLKVVNSIFLGNRRGIFIDGALALANVSQDSLVFRNNIIAADFTTNFSSPSGNGVLAVAEDPTTRAALQVTGNAWGQSPYANDSLNSCSVLTNAWSFTNPDYRPNPAGDGAVVTDPTNLSVGADLTAIPAIDNGLFENTTPVDFVVFVLENGGGTTNGQISVDIPAMSGWTFSLETNPTTSDFGGGTPHDNSNWTITLVGGTLHAVSKPGVIIEKNGNRILAFTAARNAGTPDGTNQTLSATADGGGDTTPANNTNLLIFSAN
jgi:hypothetical protein